MRVMATVGVMLLLGACARGPQGEKVPAAGGGALRVEVITEEETLGERPVFGAELSAEQCQQVALKNNAGLKAAFETWQAALERIPQVKALPDPQVSYGYFINSVETRVGAQRQRFGLAQMFPWLGKLRLEGEAAGQEALAAEQDFEALRLDLDARVREAWMEYYYLDQALRVTRENIQLLEQLDQVARSRFEVGGPLADVLRLQLELGKLEERLAALADQRNVSIAALNALMNLLPQTALPPAAPYDFAPAVQAQPPQAAAVLDHPSLKALAHRIAASGLRVQRAGKDFFPDLTLGLEYILTDEPIMPNVPDSGKDPLVATLRFNVPWDWRKYRVAVREARARERSLEAERQEKLNQMQAQLEMELFAIREAQRKRALYQDTLLPKVRESIEVAMQAYAAGQVDFLNLIDQQQLLLEFELSLERAQVDREIARARAARLVGAGEEQGDESAQ